LDKDFQKKLKQKKQLEFASPSTQLMKQTFLNLGQIKNNNEKMMFGIYMFFCVLLSHIAIGKGHVTL
jgi:hypothetical protein